MGRASSVRRQIAYSSAPLQVASGLLMRLAAGPGALVRKLSLFQQFALLSLVILLIGGYVIGRYVSGEIEGRVVQRTSALTALYVDSFVSPHLQELASGPNITEGHFDHLDQLLGATSLGKKIVAFKIWHSDGQVVYASERSLIGEGFPIERGLREALSGTIHTEVSSLGEAENVYERQQWRTLLETYAPVHDQDTGRIIGASEFYQDPSELAAEVNSSQRRGWLIVGGSTALMYALLVGLVRSASTTIQRQHRRLQELASRNARLAARIRRAAGQKTETDEQLLKRVAQDLHDGPAQDVSLALLRLDALAAGGASRSRDAEITRTALASALKEIRQICAGLRLPEMEELRLGDVVRRAAAEHEQKSGSRVRLSLCAGLPPAELPVKIAVYRVIQEALNNAYLHGHATSEEVRLSLVDNALRIDIRDNGAGLAQTRRTSDGQTTHLGIRGMRERVEMLGGSLEITAHPEGGTLVRAVLPLEDDDGDDAGNQDTRRR